MHATLTWQCTLDCSSLCVEEGLVNVILLFKYNDVIGHLNLVHQVSYCKKFTTSIKHLWIFSRSMSNFGYLTNTLWYTSLHYTIEKFQHII